jgi:hypothetical protein
MLNISPRVASSFCALAAVAWLCSMAATCWAQLSAFPGAEGVAQYISGGRGGDVYHVENLADTGPGSLRYGIQNAPTIGRTIVFDVGGQINLDSSLDFNGKDNITIAGQTAPGGITLAGSRLRINSVKDGDEVLNQTDNVIVQFLRVRPGESATNSDGVWVETATNVIVDHVTTSWAVDESISVTHDSDQVTVQWSTMSQGLFSHSYGSLLNGGMYTYAHNLYVHNKSRNPRLQQSKDKIMQLDFVNNVIYNPQDKFAYGGDEYYVNLVGNYAVRGPGTNDTNHALVRDTITASSFYVEGNYIDNNTDGEINGILAPLEGDDHDAAIFREDASYTLLGARVPVPEANVSSAAQAYVQVLSRAGATNFRDAHDRDMIRDVINQQPGFISTVAEWGAYPTLPGGVAAADSNIDGVPDAWAVAEYGDSVTPLHQTYAPDGYTYLEKYLHSLTSYAYAPENTRSHTITTGAGQGGDAQVGENGGTSATSSGIGTGGALSTGWGGAAGLTNEAIVLRFDLSEIVPNSVTEASLNLTAAAPITGVHNFKLWGLEHDGPDWDWDESTIDYASAPGLLFDGNSHTLGIDPRYTADGQPAEQDNQPLDTPGLYSLGEFSIGSMSAGEMAVLESLDLAVMLNLAAYFEGTSQEGLVTLILEQTNDTGTNMASFYSREGDALLAPSLVVDAELLPAFAEADFEEDGDVDNNDLLFWETGYGTSSGASHKQGNADADADVDGSDFLTWQRQYTGAIALQSAQIAVPEPSSVWLLACGLMAVGCRQSVRGGTRFFLAA